MTTAGKAPRAMDVHAGAEALGIKVGDRFKDIEYCASYFGDNTAGWVPRDQLLILTKDNLAQLEKWLTHDGQKK